ncbi:acid resistance periplasmic serine protease MarP, partial [Mycobacterium tuberculosis]|nr:acid resistance periplasmic serine protease MarP [Mycobacterium tuberculosis]
MTRDEFDDPVAVAGYRRLGGRIYCSHLRLACRCAGLNAVVWRGAA